jgi:hypothetical protein
LDKYGYGCSWYSKSPEECGRADTWEFFAKELCCACKDSDNWSELNQKSHYNHPDDLEQINENGFILPQIDYNNLEDFEAPNWVEFIEDDLVAKSRIHDPTVKWRQIEDSLDEFLKEKKQQELRDTMVCHDVERDRTDERGFDCEFYDEYPNECGSLDSDSFKSDELCCACGGGTSRVVQFCQDTD